MAKNLAYKTAIMPKELKHAILHSSEEKRSSVIEKNFRPVSNLTFISNIIEKSATSQYVAYITENKLSQPHQSAYKQFHSTETAL